MKNGKMIIWLCVSAAWVIFLVGCREQERPQVEVKPLCLSNTDKTAIMNAAEDVLARLHFDIEKFDIEQGIIRTRPLAGAQFFELWRHDNIGGYNAAEANLHTIRRTVELNLKRQSPTLHPVLTEGDGAQQGLCITCDVQTERLDLPEQEITSSGRAYHLFSKSGASMQRIKLNPKQEAGMSWVSLGTDSELAAEILRRIQEQLTTQSEPSASGTTSSTASARPRR
jgi:hypothetical protein